MSALSCWRLALNNMVVATVITAVIGPIVGILNGSGTAAITAWWVFSGILWLFAGIGLHFVTRGS